MSIESLKTQARRHEQQDEWQKALDQYGKAIAELAEDDQPDIALYNRVGDLYVRVGNYERALEHYERAVELYREAYLPNNAIAVCKKIIRHVPARQKVYLTMGQIRAEQGFVPDARTNFLTYAELMQAEGDLDESFRALVEFADLVPEEVDVRVAVADQMLANERSEDAVTQLSIAYRILKQKGQDDRAFGLERRLMELDPDIDFDALLEDEIGASLDDGGFEYGSGLETASETDIETDFADAPAEATPTEGALEEELVLEGDKDDDEDGPDLPLVSGTSDFDEDESEMADEEAVELPFIGFEEEEEEEEEELAEASLDEPGEFRLEVEVDEDDEQAEPAATREPEPAATDYVDLGSMIFGDELDEPKDTRFRVAYQEPSGDETADFQKMLSQFKEKVSENLDAGDVMAHHDLGTAYKEMGLLDEAISEFQAALRASVDHLPTYELMGQTFLEMGKHEAAVKSLERALKAPTKVEDDLVGIYYYLARAYEHLGRNASAVEFYDRVFSLDINFADVTERLRALR
ncbi:MAG: tetratricopeptide repeat protein [Gemmatimonadota bacterium]